MGQRGLESRVSHTVERGRVAQAGGGWLFIIDADEELVNPENIKKYLKAPLNTLYMCNR